MAEAVKLAELIQSRRRVVLPDGQAAELNVPSVAAALAIRDFGVSISDQMQDHPERAAELVLSLHGQAVNACVSESLTDEQAIQAVLATGGETGALATAAMDLCGLGRFSQAALSKRETPDKAETPPEVDYPI